MCDRLIRLWTREEAKQALWDVRGETRKESGEQMLKKKRKRGENGC